jgi:hypothetical protein
MTAAGLIPKKSPAMRGFLLLFLCGVDLEVVGFTTRSLGQRFLDRFR